MPRSSKRSSVPAAIGLAVALLAAAVVAGEAPLLGGAARQGVSDAARTGAVAVAVMLTFVLGLAAALASATQRHGDEAPDRAGGPLRRRPLLAFAIVVLLVATM